MANRKKSYALNCANSQWRGQKYRLRRLIGVRVSLETGAIEKMQEGKLGPDDAQMSQLVKEIVMALVDCPNEVAVELVEDREVNTLRVRVAPTDIGKVIGKQGRTARSLRTILGAASMKLHKRYALDIRE
jgi:predicted RNA-binding protein YlqC (UPF0109 family)